MAKIMYSVPAILLLAMGVATFDHWVNMANMPDDELDDMRKANLQDDELDEMREANLLFPARRIRFPSYNCESEMGEMNFGEDCYPRSLVTNNCSSTASSADCKPLYYYINVTKFRKAYLDQNSLSNSDSCWKPSSSEMKKVPIACVPNVPRWQTKGKRIKLHPLYRV